MGPLVIFIVFPESKKTIPDKRTANVKHFTNTAKLFFVILYFLAQLNQYPMGRFWVKEGH